MNAEKIMLNAEKTILMIEDNPDILWINRNIFVSQGYTVVTAETLAEARSRLNACLPDVIILDILLPDGDGLDFVVEIRARTRAPILMLTSLTSKDNRLSGLRAGGDDYITKPYDIDELGERVAAFLRREEMHRANPEPIVVRGPLRLDTVSGIAFLSSRDMLLTPKEFALLLLLAQSENAVLSAEALYERVWGQPMCGDANAVRISVSRLRGKLEDSGYTIETIRGEGYSFRQDNWENNG